MRILFVNALYYPTFRGGAEISVQYLAESFAGSGDKVYVICMGDTTKVYRHNQVIIIMFKERNVYSTYKLKPHGKFIKTVWHLFNCFNIFHYFIFKKLLKKIKPDLINTNSLMGISPIIWKACMINKTPIIHTIREYSLMCNNGRLYNNGTNCDKLCTACKVTYLLRKRYFDIPDFFIGISQFVVETGKKYKVIKNESRVVYNPIPVNIPETYINRVVDNNEIIFGYIGRLNAEKGVEYLVDEIIKVNKSVKNKIKIIFAGEGEPAFTQSIAQKLIDAEFKFSFLGVVKQSEFFSQINILLVTSLWNEPFGRVAIESLSYSIPICVSGRGGLKELYDPDCCWIFDPVTNGLKNLIENITEKPSEIIDKSNASKEYANKFSVANNFFETKKIFNDVLKKSMSL